MLILTRRVGETIVIGDNLVRVSVCDVRGNQVRISIEILREVVVDREEIYLRKQRGQIKTD